jgi:hypothetical protein
MRRIIALVTVLLAASLVAASPAAAATTVVVSKTGLPTNIKAIRADCVAEATAPTTAYSHVFGPGFPRSTGSLRVNPGVDSLPGLRVTSTASLANLTKLYIESYSEIAGLYADLYVSTTETDGTHDWLLRAHIAAGVASSWSPFSWLTETWGWFDQTAGGGTSGTIADFLTAHPAPISGLKIEFIASGTCNNVTTPPAYFDDLELRISGNTTVYDFEGPPGLTNAVNHGTISAGNSVTVSTTFTDGGDPMPGRTVTLWAKKAGTSSFVKIKTLTTRAPGGTASATLKPAKTTTYHWKFAGTSEIQPTQSVNKTVYVTA